jgi:hypothetical protein
MIRFLPILFLVACVPKHFDTKLGSAWEDRPTIEICERSEKSPYEIIMGLEWWNKKVSMFYNYDEVVISSCDTPVSAGVIRFDVSDDRVLKENNWSAYAYQYEDENKMISAEVFLNRQSKKRVVLHEIGHAYGWDHTIQRHHLMSHYAGKNIEDLDKGGIDAIPYNNLDKK